MRQPVLSDWIPYYWTFDLNLLQYVNADEWPNWMVNRQMYTNEWSYKPYENKRDMTNLGYDIGKNHIER